ncbi:MAG: hypothetical protein HZB51_34705 [Chloroflexi bacterium]|nr:hypothetical protein [Chloroflexota bacterium]
MQDNFRLGTWIAMIGAIIGLSALYVFPQVYNPMIDTMVNLNRVHESWSVRLVFPLLGYLAITSGVLWLLALYGFVNREKWAWLLGIVACTFSLLAGFFPMIPAMDAKVFPLTVVLFVPSLALWIGMFFVRKTEPRIAVLAFVAGLAYVLAFMNGVAPIAKFVASMGQDFINGLYVMTQEINWWGSAAWAVFIFALLSHKEWARIVGIGAGLMAIVGGTPLAVANTLEVHRFSMFTLSPLLSAALVIVLLLPAPRRLIQNWTIRATA